MILKIDDIILRCDRKILRVQLKYRCNSLNAFGYEVRKDNFITSLLQQRFKAMSTSFEKNPGLPYVEAG
jgi:hypothetical protein